MHVPTCRAKETERERGGEEESGDAEEGWWKGEGNCSFAASVKFLLAFSSFVKKSFFSGVRGLLLFLLAYRHLESSFLRISNLTLNDFFLLLHFFILSYFFSLFLRGGGFSLTGLFILNICLRDFKREFFTA